MKTIKMTFYGIGMKIITYCFMHDTYDNREIAYEILNELDEVKFIAFERTNIT